MSTWKIKSNFDERHVDTEQVQAAAETANPPVAPGDVEVLEIDLEPDLNCDPYNRTGQFCVPAFDKYDE